MPRKKTLPLDPRLDTQGQRLRRLLQGHELAKVAELLGWQPSHLSHVLADRANISDEKLDKLAKHLLVSREDIRVKKVREKKQDELVITDLLRDPNAIPRFVQCPLDQPMVNWIRRSLKLIYETVEDRRDELEKRARRAARKRRKMKEAQKSQPIPSANESHEPFDN